MKKSEKNNRDSYSTTQISWGGGGTSLFLAPSEKGGVELLDYEYDETNRIHSLCGGRNYYVSRSGCSGAGFIRQLGDLIPVGYYRVDTRYNEYQYPENVGNGISIMLPYASHTSNKESLLRENPVVIYPREENTIIYCGFYTTMNMVLKKLLSGEELGEEPRLLRRSFVRARDCQKEEEVVELKFYNLFGANSFNPWEFAALGDYQAYSPDERLHQLFHLSPCEDGSVVRTCRIGGTLYATEALASDPCENLQEPLPGWELAGPNMVYKVRKDDVHIVGWVLAKPSYDKRIERVSRIIPQAEREHFDIFVWENIPDENKYIEYELEVPKLLFFLDKEEQFAKVRKGLANKIRCAVHAATRLFIGGYNDKVVLEEIPDDKVVTLQDSLDSGNCQPGTQAFVSRYFPGKTETTAGELKKFAGNSDVMRVLRFVATRDFTLAGKLELPE